MAIQCSPGSPLLSVLIMQHSKTTNSIFGSFFFGNNILFLMCKFKCRCRSCRGAVMQCDILMKLMFTKLIDNVRAIDFTRSSCSIYPRFEDQQHGQQLVLVLKQNRSHCACAQNSHQEGDPRESSTHNLTRLSAEHPPLP